MISLTSLYLIYISLKSLIKRPIAVAWVTIRDNETRAETLGYNSFMLKAIALVISGTIASLSGGLYILYSQNINPDTAFSPLLSVYGLVYSIIGGVYMIEGPIVGATLVTILEKYLSDFVGGWSVVATGIIFIAVVLYMPKGLSYYLWHALNKIFSRGFSIYGAKNKLVRQEKI
jgi:branched-chain amino acid transport system permease protein